MSVILSIITIIGLALFIIGFLRTETGFTPSSRVVIGLIATILWLIWSYLAFNYMQPLVVNNTYFPVAVAILGAGFTLVCIYQTISSAIELLDKRPHTISPSEQYEQDKARNHERIYRITRRRF